MKKHRVISAVLAALMLTASVSTSYLTAEAAENGTSEQVWTESVSETGDEGPEEETGASEQESGLQQEEEEASEEIVSEEETVTEDPGDAESDPIKQLPVYFKQ